MAHLFDDFIGIPWRDHGRGREGCDCWGLACLVYRERLGLELASFAGNYASSADRSTLDGLIKGEREAGCEPWREIAADAAEIFDLVLLRERPWHIGIVAGPGLMLHMPYGQTAAIEPYRTGRHRLRIDGHFRHEARS